MRTWMLTIMAAALMATAFSQDYKAYGDMRANDLIPTGLAITNTARAAAGLAVTNAVQGGYLCTVQAAMQLVASHATQEQLALGLAPILAQTNYWSTAYSWGNHAGLYRAIDWVPAWETLTGKPSMYPPEAHAHDYSAITNPPWLGATDLHALSNALDASRQEGLTNTVPAAIAAAVAPLFSYAQTNRVTRLQSADGQQWMDSTGVLWRVSYELTTVIDTNRLVVSAVDAPANESPPELGSTFVVSTPGTWTCGVWAVQYDTINLRLRVFNASGRWATPREPVYPAGPEGKWRAFEVDEDAYFSIYYATDRILSVSTSVVDRVTLDSKAPTNAVSGWMVYDSGSNIWLKVTASNLSFTVWEVSE